MKKLIVLAITLLATAAHAAGIVEVPEPPAWILLATGLVGLVLTIPTRR